MMLNVAAVHGPKAPSSGNSLITNKLPAPSTTIIPKAETIASQFSFAYIEPDQYYIASDVLHLLPMEFVDKHSVIPLDRFDDTLVIVVAGPLEDEVLQEIEQLTGCTVQIFVSTVSEVRKAVETLKQGQRRAAARRETYGG